MYRILVGKPVTKWPCGRQKMRWKCVTFKRLLGKWFVRIKVRWHQIKNVCRFYCRVLDLLYLIMTKVLH